MFIMFISKINRKSLKINLPFRKSSRTLTLTSHKNKYELSTLALLRFLSLKIFIFCIFFSRKAKKVIDDVLNLIKQCPIHHDYILEIRKNISGQKLLLFQKYSKVVVFYYQVKKETWAKIKVHNR